MDRRAFFLLPTLFFLASCGLSEGPTMTPGGCGLEPYSWLPLSEVGELLWYEEDVANRYDAETMDSFAAIAGPNIPPARYGSQPTNRHPKRTRRTRRKVKAPG